jgi:hypothetical protein
MGCCTGMQTTVMPSKVRERLRRLHQRPEPEQEKEVNAIVSAASHPNLVVASSALKHSV